MLSFCWEFTEFNMDPPIASKFASTAVADDTKQTNANENNSPLLSVKRRVVKVSPANRTGELKVSIASSSLVSSYKNTDLRVIIDTTFKQTSNNYRNIHGLSAIFDRDIKRIAGRDRVELLLTH